MSPAKPRLGQNFLIDESACQRIADALGNASERTVVEIGPGHGAITDLLASRCKRLHCIEFDPSLAQELSFRYRNQAHVTVHHQNVLEADLQEFLHGAVALDVVGNLPYYITSEILLRLFAASRDCIVSRAVLMMQREVAQRIIASSGSSDYGVLSATTQMHARVTELFTLPPEAFSPPPEVYSTVVRLDFTPRFAELRVDFDGFNRFLRVSFAQKRKTLHNNLRAAGYTSHQLATAWPTDIAPQARSEAVPLAAMAKFYRALNAGTVGD